ncbi:MAG: hypothetical protein HY042_10060, partial [Spirochaetia bacterium]|nr:hypothetical protein [Spirochaetia bacterium]
MERAVMQSDSGIYARHRVRSQEEASGEAALNYLRLGLVLVYPALAYLAGMPLAHLLRAAPA